MGNFDYDYLMTIALEEAEKAYRLGEVPVGALIINRDGKIISKAHNIKEGDFNVAGHAEILALQKAAKSLESWRLVDCELIVTLEPCPMCLSAIQQSRVKSIVFGAYDFKGGALSLKYNFHKNSQLNHSFSIVGGVAHYKCSKILSDFFKEKRKSYKQERMAFS